MPQVSRVATSHECVAGFEGCAWGLGDESSMLEEIFGTLGRTGRLVLLVSGGHGAASGPQRCWPLRAGGSRCVQPIWWYRFPFVRNN